MVPSIMTETVDCPLCGADRHEQVYSRVQHLESSVGAIKICLVICRDCGFMYQNPQLSTNYLDWHYTKHSSGNTFREKAKGTRTNNLIKERKNFIEKHLISKSGDIIDVGGGQGDLISLLDLSGWGKFLLEPSNAVKRMNERCDVKVFNMRLENYIVENKFDALLCISALEHFKNPVSVIMKFSSMVKDNGWLVIEVPDSLNPKEQLAEFYSYEHLSHFTKYTLSELLMKNNFCPVAFDKNVAFSHIRVIARKTPFCDFHISNDVNLLKESIGRYKSKRELFISKLGKKLNPAIAAIRKNRGRIAIYGAGDHSKFLLEEFNIKDLISTFIDTDPTKKGKSFYNKIILSPESIADLNVEVIIISSHDYEAEIIKTINKYNKKNIEVVMLYIDTHV
jgi:SAM-dependent methyltransferase